jgi:pyruvate ferredoxin oxidoreductase gamma subunit
MSNAMKLPKDRKFEIRFESVGGLGAHAGGQVLATAAVLHMNMNGAAFSSYGSEKKGSIIRSFVRLGPASQAIRDSSPVEAPDVIVVFHSALLHNPVTLAGLRKDGILIYNSPPGAPPPELARLPKTARAVRVDALRIAVEERSRPNAVLLGTLTAIVPFLDAKIVLETLSEEFAGRHPEAVASNERAFNRGAKEFEEIRGVGKASGDLPVARSQPIWGYKTAPEGGLILDPGNSAWNDLSMSRTGWMPVFNTDKCIHCGVCDLVCPDLCLVWTAEGKDPVPTKTRLMGIDYRYCKGCLRCVESCPTEAMTREAETPGRADKLRVVLFPEIMR